MPTGTPAAATETPVMPTGMPVNEQIYANRNDAYFSRAEQPKKKATGKILGGVLAVAIVLIVAIVLSVSSRGLSGEEGEEGQGSDPGSYTEEYDYSEEAQQVVENMIVNSINMTADEKYQYWETSYQNYIENSTDDQATGIFASEIFRSVVQYLTDPMDFVNCMDAFSQNFEYRITDVSGSGNNYTVTVRLQNLDNSYAMGKLGEELACRVIMRKLFGESASETFKEIYINGTADLVNASDAKWKTEDVTVNLELGDDGHWYCDNMEEVEDTTRNIYFELLLLS